MTPAPVLGTGAEPPATPRQKRSIEKRVKLLEAGRLLFAGKGYDATPIAEITSKAGATAGAFYTYFHSKRQLLIVLMNDLIKRLSSLDLRAKTGVNARAGLRTFLAAVFRADLEFYGVVRAWHEAILTDAELSQMQITIATWTEARMLRVFQMLQKQPNARPNRDLPAFARMMDRHFWSLLARGSRMPAGEFDREVRISADVIYHYLFRDSPGKR